MRILKAIIPWLAVSALAHTGLAASQTAQPDSAAALQAPAAPSEPAADASDWPYDDVAMTPESWPVIPLPPLDAAIEAQIDAILPRLTLEQKVGQIIQADSSSVTPEQVKAYRLGSVLSGGNSAPGGEPFADAATWLEAADAYFLASLDPEGVEIAIPVIWGIDAVHGHTNLLGGTVFPHNIGLGAANDQELIREIAEATARLTGVHDAGELIALAEKRGQLGGCEVFLPYLAGERTLHNDPHARGLLMGLDHDSDAAAIGQAVLEGVAFALADGLDALAAGGGEVGDITVIGGGARSAWWGRVLAGALGRRLVCRRDGAVGPAYGAAKLALIGVTGTHPDEACAPPPVLFTIDPKAEDFERLASSRLRFREAYSRIKPLFTMESRA